MVLLEWTVGRTRLRLDYSFFWILTFAAWAQNELLWQVLLFSVLHGTSSAYVGELFNFVMGSVFSFSAGYIYSRNKSRKGALIGAVVGAALMAVLSVPFNYLLVYPAYVVCYGLPLDAIIGMYQAILPSSDSLIKCLTIFNMPFTFFKGMLDVVLCFLIYKPLSPLLHK